MLWQNWNVAQKDEWEDLANLNIIGTAIAVKHNDDNRT